tara:strand:- start:5977 stop:6552 length:576 start_codon:yes stop_codon:yes gene_type:complete
MNSEENNILVVWMMEECHSGILAGSLKGQTTRVKLCERVKSCGKGTVLYLNFSGVEVSTGSFLREAVFELRDELRKPRYDGYLIVANATEFVFEDIELLVEKRRDVLVLCDLLETPSNYRILGELEAKQQATFDLLCEVGEGDAKAMLKHTDEDVSRTAWSNRLSSLSQLGLIIEEQRGRLKWYRPLFLRK